MLTWKIFLFGPAKKHSPFLASLALNLVVAVEVSEWKRKCEFNSHRQAAKRIARLTLLTQVSFRIRSANWSCVKLPLKFFPSMTRRDKPVLFTLLW